MQSPDGLDRARAVIAGLFAVPVAVGVCDPRSPQPDLMGCEGAHLLRALDKRKREFAAGRNAARTAMAALGVTPCAIPASSDRAPVWPPGIHGSISHKSSLCAAVVTTTRHSVGLDIEEDTDLSSGLMPTICSDAELARIAGPDQQRLAKLIFSAKEAVYKAQYPLTRMLLGFDHVEIQPDLKRLGFTATFLKPAGVFAVGETLPGRFDRTSGHLVTAVWTGEVTPKGD